MCAIPVEAQYDVFDTEGLFVARGDLRLSGTRMLHEFDGAHHLAREQQRRDLARSRRLGNAGWERRGYTSLDLRHQPVAILRDADRALGRPHQPERIRPRLRLLALSSLTPSGMSRLRRRLGLANRSGIDKGPPPLAARVTCFASPS